MDLDDEFRDTRKLSERVRTELWAADDVRLHRDHHLKQVHLGDPNALTRPGGIRRQDRDTSRGDCAEEHAATPLFFAHTGIMAHSAVPFEIVTQCGERSPLMNERCSAITGLLFPPGIARSLLLDPAAVLWLRAGVAGFR